MTKIPDIKPGDLVKVYSKIKEGDKERVTPFQGVVIQTKGTDVSKTLTVRKISAGVGIERIFPVNSPLITKIEIKRKGKVRRAKLNYLRKRTGRRMKIKEAAKKSAKLTKGISQQPGVEVKTSTEEQDIKKPKEKKGESPPGQKPVENT